MRDKLFALLSVVVLAMAIAVPTTAQFASNDRSFRLRQTATANVTTPAAGSVAVFRDNLGAFSVKDSAGLVEGFDARVTVVPLAATTTITTAYLGKVIVYNGAVGTLTLPEITAANIGMQITICNNDAGADDVTIAPGAAADDFTDAADGVTDTGDIELTTKGTTVRFTAIAANEWLCEAIGTMVLA